MKFGLSDDQLRQIREVLVRHLEITEALIFGSRAMGNYKEASDVDIALKGDVGAALAGKVKAELEEGTALPFFFDVVALSAVDNPELIDHVNNLGVSVYRSGWRVEKFSKSIDIAPKVPLKTGQIYSFVEMKDLEDGIRYCGPSVERKLSGGARFEDGDTLFARITPCLENGKICQVRGLKDGIGFGSTEFFVFRGKEGRSDSDFVYYLSRSDEVRSFAEQNFDGTSGRQRVPRTAFDNLNILLPPLTEQRAIAGVFSSMDDKIDLLRRQNKTLEEMAAALWRKMFVEEADEGWSEKSLLDVIELVGGGTPKTGIAEYWGGSVPWLSAKDISANHRGFIFSTEKNITEAGVRNSAARLLPKYATAISARGTVGKYCILAEPMAFSQSNYGILPRIEECYFFTYLLVAYVVAELITGAYGSVFDTITTNTFRDQVVAVPGDKKVLAFEKMITPYFEKTLSNSAHILTLSQQRDTLLQKIISGEVAVKP